MKELNQKFNHILNKFPPGTQPHDSITIDYYTTTLPTNISSFAKRVAKETLALNFAEAIVVEKFLHAIGVITDDNESKYFKEIGRKSQPSSCKAKENDSIDIKSLTRIVKALTNEISELRRRSSEISTSRKPLKAFPFLRNNNNKNNHPSKSVESLNVVLNIESMGMDNYCSFHQEYHSENTGP